MMNLSTDYMNIRLKWCQYYKNQILELVIINDEIELSYFLKSKKKLVQNGAI